MKNELLENFNILEYIDDTESFINEWHEFHMARLNHSTPIEIFLDELNFTPILNNYENNFSVNLNENHAISRKSKITPNNIGVVILSLNISGQHIKNEYSSFNQNEELLVA